MKSIEWLTRVSRTGKLEKSPSHGAVLSWLHCHAGQDVIVRMQEPSEKWSTSQLRYYHGAVVDTVCRELARIRERPIPYPHRAMHLHLVEAFGPRDDDEPDGLVKSQPWSREDTANYIDEVKGHFTAEYGIEFPEVEEWGG